MREHPAAHDARPAEVSSATDWATPPRDAKAERKPYCLYCYAPLESSQRASRHCPACARQLLREDMRIFWTREPRFVRLEAVLKAGVLFVVGAFLSWMMRPTGHMHGYAGVGYSVGAPLLLGIILWDTASLVTHRRSLLRLETVWPWLISFLGIAPLVFLIAFMLLSGHAGQIARMSSEEVGFFVAWFTFWLGAYFATRALVNRLGRLRAHYLSRHRDASRAQWIERHA